MPSELTVAPSNTDPKKMLVGRLLETAETQRESHCRQAKAWSAFHYGFGLVAAVLSGVAGVAGLADWIGQTMTAVLALVATVVGAVIAFLKPGDRRAEEWRKANEFAKFRWSVEVASLDPDATLEQIDVLGKEMPEL
jgi:hypothetical protein